MSMSGGEAAADSVFHNAYAFADSYDLVATNIFEALRQTAWPANLDGVGPGGFAQPKMQSEVALRDVSAAATNLLRLLVIARADCDPRADGVAIGLRPFQFQ